MKDSLQSILAKKAIQYINQYDLWALVFIAIIFVGIGYGISYLFNLSKTRSEKRKIISEAEKIAVETVQQRLTNLEKLSPYKKKYIDSIECLGISLRNTISQISINDLLLFDQYREETLNIFYTNFIPSFLEYFAAYKVSYDKKDFYDFVITDVFQFLETSFKVLDGVNIDIVLKRLNKNPAKLKKTTLMLLLKNVKSTIPIFHRIDRNKYKQFVIDLNKYIEN